MRSIGILIAVFSLCLLLSACAGMPIGGGSCPAPQPQQIKTEDGWLLTLQRFSPDDASGLPVLMVPDVFENTNVYHLDERHSFVRLLAGYGSDVTLVDLRGQGASEKPTWWNDRRYDWTFDDYVRFDLPAAVEAVREATGAEKVILIGHGLGGSACFAYAQSHPEVVGGIVGIGTAGRIRYRNGLHNALLNKRESLVLLDRVPTYEGVSASAPFFNARQSLLDMLL